ncbi:hypothetical protein [Nocardioides convexus]|uniref:hypothetical protein n=1 Tax=Nocardioides convexus TaxID=2712224 RepID=UPI0024181C5B|nr:hypothetical protein [Nocardioides convexus]
MTGDAARETPARRRWLVWGVGLTVYALAVFHRSSLAVAGLAATERFDISASQAGVVHHAPACWCTPPCRSRSASWSTATAPAPCSPWRWPW